MIRVLHVIDGIGVGGAELVLIQLVEQLQKLGVQNTILSLTPVGIFRDRLIESGATLVEMNTAKGGLPWSHLHSLVRAVRNAKPDIIQGWMYHGNFAAMVLRDLSFVRVPMFWSIHATLHPRPPFARLTHAAFQTCKRLSFRPVSTVYVSHAAMEQHQIEGYSASKAAVIPNGTDCDRFSPSPTERQKVRSTLGLTNDMFVLGCFARWAPMKGHVNLIKAVSLLNLNGKNLHLVLAGTMMEASNSELSELLTQAGIENLTTCLGERRDIESLMNGLDAFVLPSIYGEAFPMVLGEAMATKVPCVATDVGDSALIIGETGLVVPPSDVDALTSAIESLIEETPKLRAIRGNAARNRISSRFSLQQMTNAYLLAYQKAVPTKSTAKATVDI